MNNEEFYIGQLFEGKYPPAAAIWCNQHNAYIDKIGPTTYEIKAIPGPTVDEKKAAVRGVRNSYLVQYVDPKQLVIVWNELDSDDQNVYVNYRKYLLDYPEMSEDWYEHNPMTFEEWKKAQEEENSEAE